MNKKTSLYLTRSCIATGGTKLKRNIKKFCDTNKDRECIYRMLDDIDEQCIEHDLSYIRKYFDHVSVITGAGVQECQKNILKKYSVNRLIFNVSFYDNPGETVSNIPGISEFNIDIDIDDFPFQRPFTDNIRKHTFSMFDYNIENVYIKLNCDISSVIGDYRSKIGIAAKMFVNLYQYRYFEMKYDRFSMLVYDYPIFPANFFASNGNIYNIKDIPKYFEMSKRK